MGSFSGPDSKVDVHHDQRDQTDAGQAMQHVHHAPGHVAEEYGLRVKMP